MDTEEKGGGWLILVDVLSRGRLGRFLLAGITSCYISNDESVIRIMLGMCLKFTAGSSLLRGMGVGN